MGQREYYFKNPNEIKLQFHYAMKSRIQDQDARLLTMKTQINPSKKKTQIKIMIWTV